MKNSLAMVQAIVAQSIRHAASLEEAGDAITARVQALGSAQDVLTRSSWERTPVSGAIQAALSPHRETRGRITAEGSDVPVVAEQALGLALAIHELATNAVKYGALSNDGGRVSVNWTSDGRSFKFVWREDGSEKPAVPGRKGFGARLLERIVPSYFAGTGLLDYSSGSLVYTLEGELQADE